MKKIVVFTGAGISAESGLGTFRDSGGLWDNYKIEDVATPDAFKKNPELVLEFYNIRRRQLLSSSPNSAHYALNKLQQNFNLQIITQNIDNLHQVSGVSSDKVIELHGNNTYAKCLSCNKRYEIEDIKKEFFQTKHAPECSLCGGIIKTATISFGQAMPEKEMIEAQKATLECDLFIAIGSSLQVYPAAGFPLLAKRNGSNLIILNREPTDLDGYADLTLNYEIGNFFDEVFSIIN